MTAALKEEIAVLSGLARHELRLTWRRLHKTTPPRVSRDLMIRAIAYKMQERLHGGLSQATRRKLAMLAGKLEAVGEDAATSEIRLKPGAKLIREWRGETHNVLVLEDGFEYGGERYRSLSKIARTITGTRWSGPRFFGLRRPARPFADPVERGHE